MATPPFEGCSRCRPRAGGRQTGPSAPQSALRPEAASYQRSSCHRDRDPCAACRRHAGLWSSYWTGTHLATETVRLSPLVTQNCSQAWPLRSLPLLPSSTLSTVNVLVCFLPSHLTLLRWLCHQAAAALLEPSFLRAGSFLPSFDCLREIQSVVPPWHGWPPLGFAAFWPRDPRRGGGAVFAGAPCSAAGAAPGGAATGGAAATAVNFVL